MKKIISAVLVISLFGCAEMQQVIRQLPTTMGTDASLSQLDISNGLKAALDKGITTEVAKLTQKNGFLGNEMVRILLPKELQKVDKTLRNIGLGNLADEGVKLLNRAAEDAVKEAIPIFSNAISTMTFDDAKGILMGNNTAATTYLQGKTASSMYEKFNPIIRASFAKTGADKVWTKIITQYNQLPLVGKVNPDLTDYTTQKALNGVFKMVAVEEKEIRNKLSSRTTDLLRRVFALQDSNRNTQAKEQKIYLVE